MSMYLLKYIHWKKIILFYKKKWKVFQVFQYWFFSKLHYKKMFSKIFHIFSIRLYAAKCTGCLQPIAPTELVMRALDYVYHLSCFLCVGCGRQLQKGDQFVIRSGRLFCRPDFEKEMTMLQLTNSREANVITPSSNQSLNINGASTPQRTDGRRGPKRPRTILTTAQRRAFKASFEISQKPCRKVHNEKKMISNLSKWNKSYLNQMKYI